MSKSKLIAVVGATATGKSGLAVLLAKTFNGEVISADSAQVYRGFNIGSAKITNEEMQGIPHHLLDIAGPETEYNIGLFQRDAKAAIDAVHHRHKLPILCGGSGLYINSVINEGYELTEIPGDPKKREELLKLEKERGEGYLYSLLKDRFPHRAKKIHPHDIQRTLRALEMETDISAEEIPKWSSPYDLTIYGLTREREILYAEIEKRIDLMFEHGLANEVRALLKAGYPEKCNAMSALGYKEVIPYLEGTYDLETAKDLLKKNTRHFAKRQETWFRRDPRIQWFDPDKEKSIENIAKKIILLEKNIIS